MKTFKKKAIWYIFIIIAAIALIVAESFMGRGVYDSTTVGFAGGLIAVSLMKLIQFYRISKNPSLRKKYEIEQKEERFIALAHRSGYSALMLSLIAEGVAIFISILLYQRTMVTILTSLACIQTFSYLIFYYYFSKKY